LVDCVAVGVADCIEDYGVVEAKAAGELLVLDGKVLKAVIMSITFEAGELNVWKSLTRKQDQA
jgi:hypothetical protein